MNRALTALLRWTPVVLLTLGLAAPVRAQMSGAYTIGPGGSFPDFSSAAAALAAQGVSGPVVCSVDSGVYVEEVHFLPIPGSSVTNTVTFTPLTALRPSLLNPAPGSHALWFDGADHIIWDRIDVLSSLPHGVGSAALVEFSGASTGIRVQGCAIQNIGTNRPLVHASGATLDGLAIVNNNLVNGSIAILLSGGGGPGIVMQDNLVSSIAGIAVENCNAPGLRIERNRIRSSPPISIPGSGVDVRLSGLTGTGIVVANNFLRPDSTGLELQMTNGPVGALIAFNSVRAVGGAVAARVSGTIPGCLTLLNNVWFCPDGGTPWVAIPAPIATADHNDLYTTGARLASWAGSDVATLPDLRAASGHEANSVSADPEFVPLSLAEFDHHSTSLSLDKKGLPIPGLSSDIDLEPRSVTEPDIGADEFALVPGSAFMLRWGRYGSGQGRFGGLASGVATDRFGNVYVSDQLNNFRVQKFTSDGTFITQWGTQGLGDGQFGGAGAEGPAGIAVRGDSVYVTDTSNRRAQVFTLNGDFVRKFGGPGPVETGWDVPWGIAVDDSNNVYVSDFANAAVRKYDASGVFVWRYPRIGFPDPGLDGPMHLAVGPGRKLFVLERYGQRVTVVDLDAQYVDRWGSAGSALGQLNQPRGIAVGPGGWVYVADTENNRVQRFSASGVYQDHWSVAKPNAITFNEDGQVYVTLYLGEPRVEKFGALPPPWIPNGVPATGGTFLRTSEEMRSVQAVNVAQVAPRTVPDNAGGVLVAWEEFAGSPEPASAVEPGPGPRGPGAARKIMLTRLDATGALESGWEPSGTPLTLSTSGQLDASLVMDDRGGALITWTDTRGTVANVYAQHLLASGLVDPSWPLNGLALSSAAGARTNARAVADGDGGVYVVWQDLRNGTDHDIYATRVLANGSVAPGWPADGLAVCTASGAQTSPVPVMDDFGGLLIAWEDLRSGTSQIHAQHLDATGVVVLGWPANGLAVAPASGQQSGARAVTDGAAGVFLVWKDLRDASVDLYAQRVTSAGLVTFGAAGAAVCAIPGDVNAPQLISDGAGGAFVTWEDLRSAGVSGSDIYVHRLTAGGVAADWPVHGYAACAQSSAQSRPGVALDGQGGVILTWRDERAPQGDIFAIGVRGNGTADPRWASGGQSICNAVGSQLDPVITTDAAGGAVIAWTDQRFGSPTVFLNRVLPVGTPTTEVPPASLSGRSVALLPSRPNPSAGPAELSFVLPTAAVAGVAVFDVMGRKVGDVLAPSLLPAGVHRLVWSGHDASGHLTPAGLYLVRLESGGERRFTKVIRIH